MKNDFIIDFNDRILITGANGFIGSRVVEILLRYGFRRLTCFVRPTSNLSSLNKIVESYDNVKLDIIKGNLQSVDDCKKASVGASVIYHLAAGRGEKSYPDAFMNSVVTTRNLLDAAIKHKSLKRFLNVSSFAVYSTSKIKSGGVLDETCALEEQPEARGEAYCYAKVRQDELVMEYGKKYNIPYVIVRPGVVYGPGNKGITGRVGIGTFGIFLHLGGSNLIPLTYVENCAKAMVLAGITKGVDGEVFNIVDDDLPTSKKFLRMYKKNVRHFKSIRVPHSISYFLCYLWEKYSKWSEEQLPPAFNRNKWSSYWKGNTYPNEKLKCLLGWKPTVSFDKGTDKYFKYCKTELMND
jgi:nucleoside-diphosphate-sugar epimerase